jgi:hypothetical protein
MVSVKEEGTAGRISPEASGIAKGCAGVCFAAFSDLPAVSGLDTVADAARAPGTVKGRKLAISGVAGTASRQADGAGQSRKT